MIFLDEGKKLILKSLLSDLPIGFDVRLITNSSIAEARTCVYADFTQATFNGYSPWTPSGYSTPAINGATEGETDGPTITWTATSGVSPQTIYGLLLTRLDSDLTTRRALFYHKFTTPQSVNIPGDTIVARVDLFDQNLVP